MKILVFESYEALSLYAKDTIVATVKSNPEAVLGLATGGTPELTYKYLVEDHKHNHTDYKSIRTFNLDEYIGIPSHHASSYHTYMRDHFFTHINVQANHIYIPNGNTVNSQKECKSYEEKIANHPIDLQILGIGSNGHIGFNEPGSAFDSKTQVVNLNQRTRVDNMKYFRRLDEVPTEAITMGIETIMKAKKIILLAHGCSKSTAVQTMVEGPISNNCPATILRKHKDVTILLDSYAAAELKEAHYDKIINYN